jgi:hypothetical protein
MAKEDGDAEAERQAAGIYNQETYNPAVVFGHWLRR